MTTEGGAPAPQSEDEEKRRRRPIAWWWWAAGGGALIAAILVVVMLAGDDADDQPDPNERVQAPTPGATTTSGGSTATEAPTATNEGGSSDTDGDVPDIEGVWEFIVTVTETSGVCAGEEGEPPGIDNVTIRRLDDGSYSVSGLGTTPDSEWTGRWDGDRFVFSGEREEDDGVSVAEFTMTFEDSVLAGIEDWSWRDADSECPTGKSEVEAFFYAPLP